MVHSVIRTYGPSQVTCDALVTQHQWCHYHVTLTVCFECKQRYQQLVTLLGTRAPCTGIGGHSCCRVVPLPSRGLAMHIIVCIYHRGTAPLMIVSAQWQGLHQTKTQERDDISYKNEARLRSAMRDYVVSAGLVLGLWSRATQQTRTVLSYFGC